MADNPSGNPVKIVFDPNTGITKNFIATKPEIGQPDRKNDPDHGHIEVDTNGSIGYRRDPGEPR